MPMVRKTKSHPAAAAIFAAAALLGQAGQAEEISRTGFKPFHLVQYGASDQEHSIEFSYGNSGLVFGGSVATENSGHLTQAVQAEQTHQLRLHAGYEMGPATGFVTVGGLQAESSGERRYGTLFGFGMRVSLNQALQLTGELLHHEAGAGHGNTLRSGETLAIGAAFRF